MSKNRLFILGLALLALVLPLLVTNKFTMHIFVMILIYAAISSAWNILAGYGGQLSLGHALFFGVGAYTSTLLFIHYDVSPWLGMLLVIGISMLLGLFIGLPTFRLKGPFFTLATIAFAEVVRLLVTFWKDVTKGAIGINIPYKPSFANMIFTNNVPYYYIALALVFIMVAITMWVDRSKMGSYLVAIREDEDAAEALGINVTRYKMYAMLISSALAGVTGVVYSQYILFIEPHSVFDMNLSVQVALMAIIGGMGTVFGPILGAILMVPLNEFLRSAFPGINGISYFIYGIALIVVVIILPNGILPTLKQYFKFGKKKKQTAGGSKG